MKKLKKNKINIIYPILGLILIILAIILEYTAKNNNKKILDSGLIRASVNVTASPTSIPTPTIVLSPTVALSPTPTPVTVENMNQDYGPCAKVNVLMYHHIQEEETAKKNGQTGLTVTPEFFRKHLQYLKDNNYNLITMSELKDFFKNGTKLPNKPVLITMDDGYKDNYEVAYPILKEFGAKATIFVATGLLNNPGYMTWDDLNQMKDLVYFGNHTWSHHSSAGTKEKLTEEITMADKQLSEHGLNPNKIFAYPYGNPGNSAEDILKTNGYEIAFTTVHGNILCKEKSLELPRIRVGNAALSVYGL